MTKKSDLTRFVEWLHVKGYWDLDVRFNSGTIDRLAEDFLLESSMRRRKALGIVDSVTTPEGSRK